MPLVAPIEIRARCVACTRSFYFKSSRTCGRATCDPRLVLAIFAVELQLLLEGLFLLRDCDWSVGE
eukprot:792124-Prorocentrum_minimum.AAC.1